MSDIDRSDELREIYAEENPDGAELLDELMGVLTRYVVLPDRHSSAAVTLWIATTHALPAFECAPRLVATSPDKRCGKSRLLDIIGGTCHSPLASINATVAAIFRSIGGEHPRTLILDEADTVFGSKKVAEQNEDLRALLNAGHQRGRTALRCVGPMQTPKEFDTFCMAALAGIGTMPDTITDRAINITMRRRAAGEQVAQFRSRRDGPVLADIRDRVADWAAGEIEALSKADPKMPVEDRAADTWEPLIAIADTVGGHWPATARAACKALVASADAADEDRGLGTKLLTDIRAIFANRKVPFLASVDLVNELRRIEESPWNDFEFSTRKLALRLKDFGVKPQRDTVGSTRGYSLETLTDSFSRYLRQEPSEPSEMPAKQAQPSDGSEPSDTSNRQTDLSVRHETAAQTPNLTGLTVPDVPPPKRRPGCVCMGQSEACEYCVANAARTGMPANQ